ncbi:hypothetical protein [Corallococcus llansteffanensis]|uniref:Lipoprotein n=1 Tax=Corallococcus llansteffanensis TaxID=2316731 RepID=A0A3A8NMI5_9BACT|nr:hypothetical protein [Corallococcus llansteffanensis]RKH45223.1 hypothetical protein D7V93_35605 [Corallococcus llansteffanensis]
MRFRLTALLSCWLLLCGCQSAGAGQTRHEYAQSMDSGMAACRQNPAYCAEVGLSAGLRTTASAGASVAGALQVMDAAAKGRVREIMETCANEAEFEVNEQHFGSQPPTAEQCQEVLKRDAAGNPVLTRAMKLGQEKHAAALRCVQLRLSVERPGGFSLEQRYRYDPKTKVLELITKAAEQELIRTGNTGPLKGTLVPDVVIHSGNPLRAEVVYDFKFSCLVGEASPWRTYPKGHPFKKFNQGELYGEALQAPVLRVSPILGAY